MMGSRGDDGFTLVEALCALAILSVVLVALYGLGGTITRTASASQQSERVALLARSRLDEIAAQTTVLPRSQRGTFPGTEISWRAEAIDIGVRPNEPEPIRLQTVMLYLSWHSDDGDHVYKVQTRHLGVARP